MFVYASLGLGSALKTPRPRPGRVRSGAPPQAGRPGTRPGGSRRGARRLKGGAEAQKHMMNFEARTSSCWPAQADVPSQYFGYRFSREAFR
jgi:hypothetical protein